MKQILLVLLAVVSLCSCSSQKAVVVKELPKTSVATQAPQRPKIVPFQFYISGSGTTTKRSDTYKMDTDRMMTVGTARKGADGKWIPLDAMAFLEENDFDTLSNLIYAYGLLKLNQEDLSSNCTAEEVYMVSIRTIDSSANVRLIFNDCAVDYNLLLEPQRTGVRKLMEWFERMRPKYRPREPE